MANLISRRDVVSLMASDVLHAVLDVRERGEFNECQIRNATSLPRSHIEFRIASLVPNRQTSIVLYDDGDGRASAAARTLADFRYPDVYTLQGGLSTWQKEGLPTISGVNVPSKAFGERVYHERNIPEIAPEELKALQDNSADLLILDVRTPEEYGRFCIPGGVNVPGGDLILWADTLKQKPDATVVVNCAGRTRSIIGTATLRRLGVTNVRALRNGTMGWVLAGFELESEPKRETPTVSRESKDRAQSLALELAKEGGIRWISAAEFVRVTRRPERGVTYLIDVRSRSEYESGHIHGSLNVPGGQAVQRADDFVAVRNGKIIFISNEATRAVSAAYWYRQMGFRDVSVLQGGVRGWAESGQPLVGGAAQYVTMGLETAKRKARLIQPKELDRSLQDLSPLVLDVGTSLDFEAAHVPGARWISRGWLDIKLPDQFPDRGQPIIVTCPDGQHSVLAARALTEIGYRSVSVLNGGVRAWTAAGYPTEKGLAPYLVEPKDVVLSPSITGDKEAMKRYLEWEVKLKG
jgi:rhodanese-related sulfurtransferase